MNDQETMEKYSSAFTLSDMEVFIFPELLYALVLANIMSPRIWKWKEDPWFQGVETLSFNRQMQRLKQYIMDHYSFNLDLETWGLTSKPRELQRFESFVDPAIFSRSNALFGYAGDKHYFDLDIRRHFGLDQYTSDVIPYWKTETVEAMDAFCHKPGYRQGAGECVSLSALYAAALYIVLQVPLEDIFLMATPLHSQNFVAREEGVITNNRRIVTKKMWFNGTELSTKARRALEKEQVTIVGHCTGYTHIEYPEATIRKEAYTRFTESLQQYLTMPVNFEMFANFLRVHERFRKYFQFEFQSEGHTHYLQAEVLYRYEHGSQCRVGDAGRKKLLEEVDNEEFSCCPNPKRFLLNMIEERLNGKPLHCRTEDDFRELRDSLTELPELDALCEKLKAFICTQPRLPNPEKIYVATQPIQIHPRMSRETIIEHLNGLREKNPTVDLAFYARRQVDAKGWDYFLKACLERNPVSIRVFTEQTPEQVYEALSFYPNLSIYDEDGLATPDEVVNFKRGDGIEKAICLLNVLKAKLPQEALSLGSDQDQVWIKTKGSTYGFQYTKKISVPNKTF
ncbi:hypothetical protein KAR34_09870 [bacterium]|nr:hypothetical protein [bacterium]